MAKGGGGGGGGKKGGGGRGLGGGGGATAATEAPAAIDTEIGEVGWENTEFVEGKYVGPGVLIEEHMVANPKQVEAIHAYTGGRVEGGDRFKDINAEILNESLYRPGSVYGKPAEYLKQLKDYENELNANLNKLKSYQGETYRIVRDKGHDLSFSKQGSIASMFEPGKVHHFKEFLSTSKSPDALFNYNTARNQVRFKIHGKSGKDIDAASAWKGMETEVLFGSGKNFMTNSKKWNVDSHTWDIEITEI